MKSGFLLDVVVGQGSTVFELLAGEDQALLVGRDAFLVLDLGLDIVDGIGRFHLEGDRLTREGLDEDLHGEDLLIAKLVTVTRALRAQSRSTAKAVLTYLDKDVFLNLRCKRRWLMNNQNVRAGGKSFKWAAGLWWVT